MSKSRDVLTPDLRRRIKQAKNPKKALEAMGLAVVSMTQRAFTQEGLRPLAWAPLKAATLKAKARKGYGSKPLMSTTALSHSPRVVEVTDRKVVVGSDRKAGGYSLASIHQLGSKDGRIPARPFFPFDSNRKITERGRRTVREAAKIALDKEIK